MPRRRRGEPSVAFYLHVEQDARRRAEAAGYDRVVPRSRMAREAAALVEGLLAREDRRGDRRVVGHRRGHRPAARRDGWRVLRWRAAPSGSRPWPASFATRCRAGDLTDADAPARVREGVEREGGAATCW